MTTLRECRWPGTAVLAVALLGGWLVAEARPQTPAPTASIAGAWTLNKDLSDQPQDSMQAEGERGRRGDGMGRGRGGRGMGRGRGRGGTGGAGTGEGLTSEDAARLRDAIRAVREAPDHLTITQTNRMVVITTGDGRTTRLSLDGKTIKDENTGVERTTRWEGGKLVSGITGLVRGKIIETFSVDTERRLHVAVAMENPLTRQPATMNRVYDADR